MKKAIIIDLDGTLANISHRRHFAEAEKGKRDWKSFYAGIGDDEVNIWCKNIIDLFNPTHDIILVSGRPENYREITEQWLLWNDIKYRFLFMRPKNDQRDDTIIKKEIYEKYIKYAWNITFAVDDRDRIVDMWRSIGITCLQCARGDF